MTLQVNYPGMVLTVPNPDSPFDMPIYEGNPDDVRNVLNPGIYIGYVEMPHKDTKWDVKVYIGLTRSYMRVMETSTRFVLN